MTKRALDNRRVSNGEQINRLVGLALKAKPSVEMLVKHRASTEANQDSGPSFLSRKPDTRETRA